MFFSKAKICILLALSVLLLSGCEVYKTLYGESSRGNATFDSITTGAVKETPSGESAVEDISLEKQAEPSNVIVVQETEFVSLQPEAEDPDQDQLSFTFTSPLDEQGNWQTAYGDEGEYTITLTASDGQLTTSKDVLLIVKKKEEPPVIEGTNPIEAVVFIDEATEAEFMVNAKDLNDDLLSYQWKLDGESVGEDQSYIYAPDYDAAGAHTLKVDVSDGASAAGYLWSVNVNNINRKPVITEIPGIAAKEDEEVAIVVEAFDDDGDDLAYMIDDARFTEESEGVFSWKTDYNSAGSYVVKVSVGDGQDTVTHEVNVEIENVNRAPVIIDIVQKK